MKKCLLQHLILYIVFGICLTLTACSGQAAEELFETAQFEELQRNHEHAKQLYKEIIDTYPESEFARMSERRLAELEK